jgi:drug/metabolite transporter (DMT)-like permease
VRHLPAGVLWAAGVTVLLWSSAFPGIRAGLNAFSPGHLVLLRFLAASIFFALLAFAGRVQRPEKSDFPYLILSGFLGITAYQLFLNFGQKTVSSGVASLLVNTAPIWTALLAVPLLGERLSARQWSGLALGLAGSMMLIASQFTLGFSAGAWLVLAASWSHASSFLVQKPLLKRFSPVSLIAWTVWFGTLFFLPFGAGFSEAVRQAPRPATAVVIYLGIGPAALAYMGWAYVLTHLPASEAVGFLYLIPVCSMLLARLWLGETPTALAVLGGVVAIAGVFLVQRGGPQLGRERPHGNA